MRIKRILFISLATLAIVLIIVYFTTSLEYRIKQNVTIKCNYVAYACGDCYPRYNVQHISTPSLEPKLLRKDIDIRFSNRDQQKKFEKQVGICGICYTYRLSGNLSYSIKQNCYILRINNYNLLLENKNCCTF